jgi:drug/metabolite transporter (DMT)-like permease
MGLERTLVIYSSIIFSIYPFFIALLAHYFIPGDQLTRRSALGLLIAFLGIVTIFLGKLGSAGQSVWIGNLLTLLSALCLGIQFVYTKKIIRGIDPIKLLFWQMVYSVPGFFLLSLLLERGSVSYELTPKVIWALLYQGIVVAGLCFMGRNLLLKYYPASKLSAFFFTSPLFGVVLSILILHEPITPTLLAGGSFVGLGIYLVNSR